MRVLTRTAAWVLGAALLVLVSSHACQASMMFGGSSGTLAAQATFDLTGTTLTVTLTNTGAAAGSNGDLLHGLFFDVTGSPTLAAGTANLNAGSTQINFDGTPFTGTNVAADGFGFGQGLSGGSPASYGIASAGFGLFGGSNFAGSNGQALDGTNWGIANGVTTPNSISGGQAPPVLVDNSMVFTLTGFTASLSDIKNVSFQYNTSLSGTNIPGTPAVAPEPPTIIGATLASLLGLGLARRRRAS
jgi:hypothetical protein